MPQMSPIWWLSLFMMFLFIFIMFNIMNYFNFNPKMPKNNLNTNFMKNYFNWKW